MGVLALTLVTLGPGDSEAGEAGGGSEASAASAASASPTPLALIQNRRVLSYPMDQVWPTAIRYLRIDRGFKITDRDSEAGFMLFEFPLEGARLGSGSLEMFSTEDAAGRPSVSIAVATSAGPVHLPNALLDGIAAKVRAERGQPSPPPRQEEPPKQDDPEDEDHSVPLLPPARDPGEDPSG